MLEPVAFTYNSPDVDDAKNIEVVDEPSKNIGPNPLFGTIVVSELVIVFQLPQGV